MVGLKEVFPQGLGFVLVFEFMVSDLGEMISNIETPIDESHIKSYTLMLLRGVAFMHRNSIMHRDLKPANLLISSDGRLKIADLGLSRIFLTAEDVKNGQRKRHYSHQVATRWYRAPELLYGSRTYTEGVDLWSVGCIFGEMINRSPIFPGENDIDQLGIVIRALGTPNNDIWPGVTELPDYSKITFPETAPVALEEILATDEAGPLGSDLFTCFVRYDSAKRLSAEKALDHAYFREEPRPANLSDMPVKPKIKKGSPTDSLDFRVDLSLKEVLADLNEIL